MKGCFNEYKVTVYYIDKNNKQKQSVHKYWTSSKDTSRIAETSKLLERKYNMDLYKVVGVSVQ